MLQSAAISVVAHQTTKGSIEGNIRRAGSREPIPGAHITVRSSRGQESIAISGPSGKFVVSDLAAGVYRILVAGAGYISKEYGQNLASEPGASVNLAAGETLRGIDIELTPAASVSGRIRDDLGHAVIAMQVQLLRASYDTFGRRSLHTVRLAQTDERGEYRILLVPPGRYFVVTGSTGEQLGRVGSDDKRGALQKKYALTYYPGVLDIADAAVLAVQAGQHLAAVDSAILPQKTYTIRGRVIDATTLLSKLA